MDKETVEQDFARFEELMDEDRIYMVPELDFRAICSLTGADPGALDAFLREDQGMGGDEILREYRRQAAVSIAAKAALAPEVCERLLFGSKKQN